MCSISEVSHKGKALGILLSISTAMLFQNCNNLMDTN